MKNVLVFLIFVTAFTNLFSQAPQRRYDIKKAYLYQEEELLISETDLNCSFFIGQNIKKEIVIVGAEDRVLLHQGRTEFSDGERLYINKGARDGIGEGDIFLVVHKGKKIPNPFSAKSLGTYYLNKSLAEVTCLFEDRATVTLKQGCNPVQLGEMLLPYKKEQTVFKKRVDYKKCGLPESEVEGRVVYNDLYIGIDKKTSGDDDFIAVDLGKAVLKKGDFVLFYRIFKKNLPPLIFGVGIVVNPQNTNSTVKILEVAYPVELGDRVALLPVEAEELLAREDQIPMVEPTEKTKEAEVGEEVLEKNILFEIDSFDIAPMYKQDFDQIHAFVQDKSEFIIILKGYTCSIGGLEHNLELSQKRVEMVKEFLSSQYSIDEKFFQTYYYGEKEAPFDNTSEAERRKNRLVSIQVIGK